MSQTLFTMAPAAMGTSVKPQMKVNNTSRQGMTTQMRASAHPIAGARNLNSSKYNAPISVINSSSRTGVKMSASSNAGISNSFSSKAMYSNFSSAVPSGNNYLSGGGMSMNAADTSKWGKQMGASSFTNNEVLENMNSMAMKSKGINMSSQPSASSSGDFSFNVAGAPMNVQSNYQDFSFFGGKFSKGAQAKKPRSTGFKLMALPEGAEGTWGGYDRQCVIGGNWKSNGDIDFATKHITDTLNKVKFDTKNVEVVIAPTDIHLSTVKSLANKNIHVSAQDVSQYGRGAYTGNVTADQLTDIGIMWTLTGHSERRTLFGETDQDVAVKTKIAIENGMNVMVCIGELLEERETKKTDEVNARQLQAVADELTEGQWGNVVVAYEPVWAIGTGKVATPEQAEETHAHIRAWLHENISEEVAGATRILYGGSVNGENAATLIGQDNIDGFLVGGASLKPEFADIIKAADEHKK